jgi:hypothetical protein
MLKIALSRRLQRLVVVSQPTSFPPRAASAAALLSMALEEVERPRRQPGRAGGGIIRRYLIRNQMCPEGYRGFESLSLR